MRNIVSSKYVWKIMCTLISIDKHIKVIIKHQMLWREHLLGLIGWLTLCAMHWNRVPSSFWSLQAYVNNQFGERSVAMWWWLLHVDSMSSSLEVRRGGKDGDALSDVDFQYNIQNIWVCNMAWLSFQSLKTNHSIGYWYLQNYTL
jgi:hypothetical protein